MTHLDFSATPEDGKAILEILESSAAKGDIELIYTRRPDAFASYSKEYGDARVFISKKDGRAVGTCAEILRDVYIGGQKCKAAYICGLKKDAGFDGHIGFTPSFIRGLEQKDVDFYYCSVVADNKETLKTFEGLKRILAAELITRYTTYILNPKVRIKSDVSNFEFRQARECDIPRLLEFINAEGRKHDLFPCVNSLDGFHGLSAEDFYILSKNGSILAVGALWNQRDYKQYVVKRYGGIYRLARRFNFLLNALSYIKLPEQNFPLDFPTLSFMLFRDGKEEYFKAFFNAIAEAAKKRYGMLVIGLPEAHFAAKYLNALPKISFDTLLYSISFPQSGNTTEKVERNSVRPECGLL